MAFIPILTVSMVSSDTEADNSSLEKGQDQDIFRVRVLIEDHEITGRPLRGISWSARKRDFLVNVV